MTIEVALFICTAAICVLLAIIVRELNMIGYLLWYSFVLTKENEDETERSTARRPVHPDAP